MSEKTLEELLEEELKDQMTDISMLHTGTPEKSEAIKGFSILYDKRQDAFKRKADAEEASARRKDRKIDHVMNGVGIGLPILAYGVMYVIGLDFEKSGTLGSTFVRNLVGKMKFTK